MAGPIKFEPNDKISSEDKARKGPAAPKKFKEAMDDNTRKSVAKLKKHNKGLDSEAEDIEEFGKVKEPSPFDLQAKKKAQAIKKEDIATTKELPEEKQTTKVAEKPRSDVITSEVLTQGATAAISQAKVEAPKPTTDIQQLIEQITEHISEMKYAGKTETLVTLKHPPLFANANLVLTSFDSAKGEFNIAFENLTQQAKNFLDSGNHLDTLKANLEQKGFIAHIVTTTTIVETKTFENQQTGFARGEEHEDEQQQQQEQEESEENA